MKKFDVVLMNPPYDRNLHLKFLEKTISIAENVISVQPCEFISRTHTKSTYTNLKNKYKNTIGLHLSELELIDQNCFDAKISTDLGIYVLNDYGGFDYDNFNKTYDSGRLNAEKIFNTGENIKCNLQKFNNQKYFVPIRTDCHLKRWFTLQLINYLDIIVDGKVYSGVYKGLTISEARKMNPREIPRNSERTTYGVSFNTLEEAVNFRDSLKLEAYLFIIALMKTSRRNPLNKLPMLGDYTNKLTNASVFHMFNIKNEIQKDIIEDMKIFKEKTNLSADEILKRLLEIQDKYLNNL